MEPSYYLAPSRLGLGWSVFFVYVVAFVVPAVAAVLAFARALRMRRRARRAHADFARHAPLAPGHATLLGTIETREGGPAVVITIQQAARAVGARARRSVQWYESARQTSVEPFDLVLDSGERVRVRADETLRLCDPLAPPQRGLHPTLRTRAVTLENGARVHAVGFLSRERSGTGGAYRDGGGGWVLARSRSERLILSSKPFDTFFARNAGFSWRIAVGLSVMVVAGFASFRQFHGLNVRGAVHRVPISWLRESTYATHAKNGMTTHFRVEGEIRVDGDRIELGDDTSAEVYEIVRRRDDPSASLPFVIDLGATPPRSQIGVAPGISIGQAMLSVAALALVGTGYWFAVKRRQLWWEKKRVVDVE